MTSPPPEPPRALTVLDHLEAFRQLVFRAQVLVPASHSIWHRDADRAQAELKGDGHE